MSIRPVKRVVSATPHTEGAGVKLRRAFGFGDTTEFDPFLLFDDFRNDNPDDYLAGFPWHPHRGIETITYVLAGNVEHGDSLGNRGSLGAGDVQWMTAGSGIMHQEMPQGDAQGRMHGFQLWANLPASLKMTAPRYQDIAAADIPEVVDDDGTRVRVIVGDFWGKQGPVEGVAADPQYIDVSVAPGKRKRLKVDTTRHAFAYVFAGSGTFRDASDPRGVLTEATDGSDRVSRDRRHRQPIAGAVRQRRRSGRPGGRRRHPVPAGLRQAARGAGGVVRADRDEHPGASCARRSATCATARSSSKAGPFGHRAGRVLSDPPTRLRGAGPARDLASLFLEGVDPLVDRRRAVICPRCARRSGPTSNSARNCASAELHQQIGQKLPPRLADRRVVERAGLRRRQIADAAACRPSRRATPAQFSRLTLPI